MDRKTKHRILGILVVIGLVIILLPLFQSGKEIHNETAAVSSAPPFPDQPIQVAATTSEQKPITPKQDTGIPQTVVNATNNNDNGIKQQPDDTISVIHPSVINQVPAANNNVPTKPIDGPAVETNVQPAVPTEENANTTPAIANPSSSTLAENTESMPDTLAPISNEKTSPVADKDVTIKKKPVKAETLKLIEKKKNSHVVRSASNVTTRTTASSKPRLASTKKMDEEGLTKLKSAAWVIQIGSYKNKTNALRIVNELRANGYRAFIQQISTALGEHTRVFVGPENKRSSARVLADRLQSEMHIQGIVISYKPLTL